jgi:hypothetical protein
MTARRFMTLSLALKTSLVVSTCLLGLSLSAREFMVSARDYDLFYAAHRIDRGQPVNIAYVSSLLDTVDRQDIVCRHDVVTAVTTARFHVLDVLNGSLTKVEHWDEIVAKAGRYAEKAVTCFPTDGTLWLRLAVIRWVANAPADSIATAMIHSQHFAPVESGAVLGRLTLWNRLSRAAVVEGRKAAIADLAILASNFAATFEREKINPIRNPSPAMADLLASVRKDRVPLKDHPSDG